MLITRRDFLTTSLAATAGLTTTPLPAATPDRRCIFLMLVGGPSQLDTWDPKPDAPGEVRGPFATIPTRTPGVRFSELFPRMAANSEHFALIRSMHHDAAPIHETGMQLMQTGRIATSELEHPHFGALASRDQSSGIMPANVLLPGPIGFTGVNIGHGQSAGRLGPRHEPVAVPFGVDDDPRRSEYGSSEFGDNCLRAARLIETGSRFVTVNMFTGVYDAISWDCHAAGGSLRSTLHDYRQIGPIFDIAFTALIDDLRQRGLLDSTLVIATGEFGRTPHVNRDGGRDHWAGIWSMLMAGAGIRGGEVIGSSDRLGAEPRESPVSPEQFSRRVCQILGLHSF